MAICFCSYLLCEFLGEDAGAFAHAFFKGDGEAGAGEEVVVAPVAAAGEEPAFDEGVAAAGDAALAVLREEVDEFGHGAGADVAESEDDFFAFFEWAGFEFGDDAFGVAPQDVAAVALRFFLVGGSWVARRNCLIVHGFFLLGLVTV